MTSSTREVSVQQTVIRQPLLDVLESLLDRDPDCEDRIGVGAILSDLNQLAGWLEARKVRCARRLRQLADEGRSESAGSALMNESRHSAAEANRTQERERICHEFPALEDKLASGAISADHLDTLARLTKHLSDQDRSDLQARADELVATTDTWVSECGRRSKNLIDEIRLANRPDADDEKQERHRNQSHVKRWTDKVSGLRMTLIGLDAMRDTTIHNMIDAHLARLRADAGNSDTPFQALHAQALVDAITNNAKPSTPTSEHGGSPACVAERDRSTESTDSPAGDTDSGPESGGTVPDDADDAEDRDGPNDVEVVESPAADERAGNVVTAPEIVVHVDLETFLHGRHQHTMCETVDGVPVPPGAFQRMCCEAVIQAIIVRPDGSFDRLCAEQRLASRKQRRALASMYATCAHPDCSVPFSRCRIHHVVPFNRGGSTTLANMIPVCERHHHLIHEGGWTLTMTADRVTTWRRPDGETWWTGASPNRRSTRPRPPASPVKPLRPAGWQQPTLI